MIVKHFPSRCAPMRYMHTHARKHIYTHTNIQVYTYVNMQHTYKYTYKYTCIHAHAHNRHTCTCTYARNGTPAPTQGYTPDPADAPVAAADPAGRVPAGVPTCAGSSLLPPERRSPSRRHAAPAAPAAAPRPAAGRCCHGTFARVA